MKSISVRDLKKGMRFHEQGPYGQWLELEAIEDAYFESGGPNGSGWFCSGRIIGSSCGARLGSMVPYHFDSQFGSAYEPRLYTDESVEPTPSRVDNIPHLELSKPPLGTMPRKIWMEHRAEDLMEAILRNRGRIDHRHDLWLELQNLLVEINNIKHQE